MKAAIFFIALSCFANVAFASSSQQAWRIADAVPLNYTLYESDPTISKRGLAPEITWYNGEDLKNAACYGQRGLQVYNARPSDFIGAMWMKGLEMCYKCLEIKNNRRNVRPIIIKIIDKCAGCPRRGNNVDLTEAAFKKLAPLDDGRVEIAWRPLPNCPKNGIWPTFEQGRRR